MFIFTQTGGGYKGSEDDPPEEDGGATSVSCYSDESLRSIPWDASRTDDWFTLPPLRSESGAQQLRLELDKAPKQKDMNR